MNLQLKCLFLTVLFALSGFIGKSQIADTLSVNFKNPPASTKPWVYWYWISDHISREGITKDLEAMAEVGIGEALIGNIVGIKQKGDVKALTEEWFQMIEFAIQEGKRLGVIFTNIGGNAGFTEISLSGAARTERFIEKQLAKLWPTPAPLWDAYMWPASSEIDFPALAVNPQKVINISSKMESDGTLEWDVPAGEWIIQRIGMTPTGQKNAPASVEATGLEVATLAAKNPVNFVRNKTIGQLSEAWIVYFDKKWGVPDSVVFDKLEDWTNRPEAAIKFYSGTARYRKVFDAPEYEKNTSVFLNLGAFNSLAVVKLNGESLGLVWAEPHQIDISKYMRMKNNVLEIEITNTWNNRLVGDAALPAEKRITYATISPDANAPLMPSGLLEPVVFQISDPKPYVQKALISSDILSFTKPGKAVVSIACPMADAKIYYTLDVKTPTEKSKLYSKPFEITDYTMISAKAFLKGMQASEISSMEVEATDPKINGLNYEYFEGLWNMIPDFSKLTPLKKGKTTSLDPSALKSGEDHFAINFSGFINIPEAGDYTFYLLSDDGSRLYVDSQQIVDNDGCHG